MMHTIDGQVPVAEVVAQTFDDGALFCCGCSTIGVEIRSAPRVRKHQARSLTASKERLHE